MRASRAGVRFKQPSEAVAGAASADLPAAGIAIETAAIVAAMLGSEAMLEWASRLPVGPAGDIAVEVTQQWDDAMRALGVTSFSETVAALLRAFEAMR